MHEVAPDPLLVPDRLHPDVQGGRHELADQGGDLAIAGVEVDEADGQRLAGIARRPGDRARQQDGRGRLARATLARRDSDRDLAGDLGTAEQLHRCRHRVAGRDRLDWPGVAHGWHVGSAGTVVGGAGRGRRVGRSLGRSWVLGRGRDELDRRPLLRLGVMGASGLGRQDAHRLGPIGAGGLGRLGRRRPDPGGHEGLASEHLVRPGGHVLGELDLICQDPAHRLQYRPAALLDRQEVVDEAARDQALPDRSGRDELAQVRQARRPPDRNEHMRAGVRHGHDRAGGLDQLAFVRAGPGRQGVGEDEYAGPLVEPTAGEGVPHGRDARLPVLNGPADAVTRQQIGDRTLRHDDDAGADRGGRTHHRTPPRRQPRTSACGARIRTPLTPYVTLPAGTAQLRAKREVRRTGDDRDVIGAIGADRRASVPYP